MKGILFTPEMIQAIVEGRKTQTRRLGGLKIINRQPDIWELNAYDGGKVFCFNDKRHNISSLSRFFPIECKPRYQVGETVYIKEAFMIEQAEDFTEPTDRPFKNDYEWGLLIPHYKSTDPDPDLYDEEDRLVSWRSPLFMPEWAARYFIKILAVRAERLQEITDIAAVAEGIIVEKGRYIVVARPSENGAAYATPRDAYIVLWNSINKDYPWESNPWVEVDTFKFERR